MQVGRHPSEALACSVLVQVKQLPSGQSGHSEGLRLGLNPDDVCDLLENKLSQYRVAGDHTCDWHVGYTSKNVSGAGQSDSLTTSGLVVNVWKDPGGSAVVLELMSDAAATAAGQLEEMQVRGVPVSICSLAPKRFVEFQ
eukprot:CAMPEP_0196577470 /NCGR_PEP_ID=MMETSP1081-20130531/6539_1 /TAXON_ID=36882 /ORGANISM="Pyramimonas amylifera, Strain CCMP720" /LENGTH=139 /DNA_ID=CAMNT_0041896405 /DNA_START=86 /DNA_END=505 /DNA_ORIENTATION=+